MQAWVGSLFHSTRVPKGHVQLATAEFCFHPPQQPQGGQRHSISWNPSRSCVTQPHEVESQSLQQEESIEWDEVPETWEPIVPSSKHSSVLMKVQALNGLSKAQHSSVRNRWLTREGAQRTCLQDDSLQPFSCNAIFTSAASVRHQDPLPLSVNCPTNVSLECQSPSSESSFTWTTKSVAWDRTFGGSSCASKSEDAMSAMPTPQHLSPSMSINHSRASFDEAGAKSPKGNHTSVFSDSFSNALAALSSLETFAGCSSSRRADSFPEHEKSAHASAAGPKVLPVKLPFKEEQSSLTRQLTVTIATTTFTRVSRKASHFETETQDIPVFDASASLVVMNHRPMAIEEMERKLMGMEARQPSASPTMETARIAC